MERGPIAQMGAKAKAARNSGSLGDRRPIWQGRLRWAAMLVAAQWVGNLMLKFLMGLSSLLSALIMALPPIGG